VKNSAFPGHFISSDQELAQGVEGLGMKLQLLSVELHARTSAHVTVVSMYMLGVLTGPLFLHRYLPLLE